MDISGIKFKSISDLAKQLNVSASGISKYIKKYGDIETGVTAYLNKEGGQITVDGISYPSVLLALVKLDILPADYKACKNFENLSPIDTISKLTSVPYVESKLPILFEDKFYESLLDVCRENGKSYETVSAYATKYGKSIKYALFMKLKENKIENDSSTVFSILGINYKTKAEFFSKSNYNVSPKTIYKFMKDNNMDFQEAVVKYITEHAKTNKKKYKVHNTYFENLAQVCNELNVSKKEYQLAYTKNNNSHNLTIDYLLKNVNKPNSNTVEMVCLDNKINYGFVKHYASSNNISEEDSVTSLVQGRKVYRNIKNLTQHQLHVLNVMIANNLVLIPSDYMQFSLQKKKTGEEVNCRTYKIYSISQTTVNSLVNLHGLILGVDKKDKKLYPNKDLVSSYIAYSNALRNFKSMEKVH